MPLLNYDQSRILISACLLGDPVRYNGTNLLIDHPLMKQWQQQGRLIPICPEVAGGMPVLRAPAEIQSGSGKLVLTNKTRVIDDNQQDVTEAFILGAEKALELAKKHHCQYAILTERSPSCGTQLIYDGSFSNTRISGMGVTAALLKKYGIQVFNQYNFEGLDKCK